jgi:hypothetical protein
LLYAIKKPRQQLASRAFSFNLLYLYYRQFHVLEVDFAILQHGFYHGVLAHFPRENLLAQLVEDDALNNALERTGAELRVEALLAEVVEHFVGGFEGDAGLVQALLNLLELDIDDAAGRTIL